MGVIATKILGYTVMFGVPAFLIAYMIEPHFRNAINQFIMGTG